jgi:hypothetical protein
VQRTVDALVDSECRYQFSQTTTIEDVSLPEEKQRVLRNNVDFDLIEAARYAVKDLEAWQTTEKAKKWIPGIKLFLEFDFQFDEEVTKRFDAEKAKRVRQVSLNFWLRKDKVFGEKVVISIHPWEEYVLMFGQEKTHNENKKQILKIVENVCNYITPHYGWLDSEDNSLDAQYDFMDREDWSVRNEFAVIGPQLLDKVSKYNLNVYSILENGCLLLYSSAASQEAG